PILEEHVLLLRPLLQAGVQRAAALCRGLGCPQFLLFPLSPPQAAERSKKRGFWGHPKPRQGDPAPLVLRTFTNVRDDSYAGRATLAGEKRINNLPLRYSWRSQEYDQARHGAQRG
ncbi:MAG TPA: hypothetical protein VFV38_19555, partial [Ktedonobacteraceae bacterium]|nr:hypothetical protein [Ktedonobacteraceae bacterium]